jgi:hypothetical protein
MDEGDMRSYREAMKTGPLRAFLEKGRHMAGAQQ